MLRHWKLWLLAIVIVYLIGVGAMVFRKLSKPPEYSSSPTVSRAGLAYEEGYLGILEPADPEWTDAFSATEAFAQPVLFPGDSNNYLVDWQGEVRMDKGAASSPWVKGLQGDDAIELVAFATWVPQPDDELDPARHPGIKPVFRDPATLQEISGEELEKMGMPPEFRHMDPAWKYQVPKIRLIVRSQNMEYLRIPGGTGGDVRTQAGVTYDLDSLNEEIPSSETLGEWARLDLGLLIWHDTPLKLRLRVLTGSPETATLQPKAGEQAVFSGRLRVQWLGEFSGEMDVGRNLSRFTLANPGASEAKQILSGRLDQFSNPDPYLIQLEEDKTKPGMVVFRANSKDDLTKLCGWRRQGEKHYQWKWNWIGENGQIQLAAIPSAAGKGVMRAQPMELLYLPNQTEVVFDIAGLPDQPNPSGISDLFDVRIPRLTLPDRYSRAEDHLLGTIGTATEVDFSIENVWEDMPTTLPADRTFRNQTPRELLAWYLTNTPGARVRYDDIEKQIFYNEERENWWTRFLEWLESF